MALITDSFNAACSTRNFVAQKWDNHTVDCWPPKYIPNEPPGDFDYTQQPLLRWYASTSQPQPQSISRVPEAIASYRVKEAWNELAAPWNVNHQLSVPLRIGENQFHSYLIQRPDDFTEQEFDLAFLLQPVLSGITVHLRLASGHGNVFTQASMPELTLREMGILTLLGKGATAEKMARQLRISPRTAGKHLEHIYRKLDVGDRLMAVQRAYELGLLTPPEGLTGHGIPAHGLNR